MALMICVCCRSLAAELEELKAHIATMRREKLRNLFEGEAIA